MSGAHLHAAMASADEAAASERWLSGSVRKDGARDLLSGMISGFFCKILEHGRVAKQGRYGRPSGVYQLAEAGRGWPRLEAPLSLIWRWWGVPKQEGDSPSLLGGCLHPIGSHP